MPGSVQRDYRSSIHPWRAALVNPSRLGPLNPILLTLFDKAAFHLRYHAEDGDNHVTHFASRADMRVENGDERASLREHPVTAALRLG